MKCQEDGEDAGVQPMLDCDFIWIFFSFQTMRLLKCFVNFSCFKYIYFTVHSDFDNFFSRVGH